MAPHSTAQAGAKGPCSGSARATAATEPNLTASLTVARQGYDTGHRTSHGAGPRNAAAFLHPPDGRRVSLLQVAALTVGWPGDAPVLHGVTLHLAEGERVGLIGPNGAGKSSLFHAIAGVLAPTAGSVRFRGHPVRLGAFQPGMALMFQQAEDQLFCPTLAEDVAFGPRHLGIPEAEISARVATAIAACGLAGLEARPVHRLSSGEKRRACIAGALAMDPALLLLDEPSSALDLRNRRRLIALLAGMQPAMLIASHDLELLLELCPRVVLIDDGRIRADGPARAVLGDAALMAAHGQEVPQSLTVRGTGPAQPGDAPGQRPIM